MNFPRLTERPKASRPSLRRVLYRAHLGIALVAMCMAGLALSLVSLLTLRAYAENNLHLIGRSLAYTVEAAVVFNDRAAAEEALRLIAAAEEVSQCAVYDRHGQLLASWHREGSGALHGLSALAGRLLLGAQSVQPIVRNGQVLGEIHLTGSGGRLLVFLLTGTGGMLACLALASLGVLYLTRRTVGGIVEPLDQLARVAHAVRRDRAFARRVPPTRIAELDELGSDFNALLDEMEDWQANLQHENASLAHRANHDSLTLLPNRAFFEGRLSRALRDLAQQGGRAAVLFIDTDRFKDINDSLGHAAGDAALVDIAQRLRGQLREHDLVARISGDEFAVLLAPLEDVEVALRIADDILASMQTPIVLPDDSTVQTSLTIGVAYYPQHGTTPEALLHAADTAMYRAKRRARGTRKLAQATRETPEEKPHAMDDRAQPPTAQRHLAGPEPERLPDPDAGHGAEPDPGRDA
ncbi:MAG: Diguanylate cyclase DgcN [Stenotrophomonas maltophilia]|nr:MAG: Diguanylate cyclase DgcN [Stenotrophomonas maltophilia]